ncbi:MAG: MFS transporter [Chloroflexi bacterium]|nr:MFS transporter [Chloroflexota bacterium]
MSLEPAEGDRLVVLRHPDLRRYLSARFLASLATQVQTVAVGWQVFTATGDPFDLGLVALSQFLPFILLILPAGHVADRYDRRRVQLATYLLLAVCAGALLALSLNDVRDLLPVYGVMVLFGIARAFNQPTSQACCRTSHRWRGFRARWPSIRRSDRSPRSSVRPSAGCSCCSGWGSPTGSPSYC